MHAVTHIVAEKCPAQVHKQADGKGMPDGRSKWAWRLRLLAHIFHPHHLTAARKLGQNRHWCKQKLQCICRKAGSTFQERIEVGAMLNVENPVDAY